MSSVPACLKKKKKKAISNSLKQTNKSTSLLGFPLPFFVAFSLKPRKLVADARKREPYTVPGAGLTFVQHELLLLL